MFLKIKPDTEAYQFIHKIFDMSRVWAEKGKEIDAFFGMDTMKKVGMATNLVYITEIPEGLDKREFKKQKEGEYYVSRSNSKLTKDWQQFCATHGLYCSTITHFALTYNLIWYKITAHKFDDVYVIEMGKDPNEPDFLEKRPFFEVISASEFYDMMAKRAKELEKKRVAL